MSSKTFLLGLLVLVLATGGTAAAAKLLTGKDVRDGSLTGADLRDRSVTRADLSADVRTQIVRAAARGAAGPQGPAGPTGAAGPQGDPGLRGPDGTPGGRTRADADAAYLAKNAKAVDAARLNGVDGDDFVTGDASTRFYTNTVGAPNVVTVATIPGAGDVEVGCQANLDKDLRVTSTGAPLTYTVSTVFNDSAPESGQGSVPANGTGIAMFSDDEWHATLMVRRPGASPLDAESFTTVIVTAINVGASCRIMARTIEHERDQTTLIINP